MVAISDNNLASDDSLLGSQVSQALRGYDAARFSGVRVISHSGVITLVGNVPNWYSRSLAYQLATRQPLVSRVVDALSVK